LEDVHLSLFTGDISILGASADGFCRTEIILAWTAKPFDQNAASPGLYRVVVNVVNPTVLCL